MSKKPFNQIVKFMAPGSGVQILGLGQYVKKRLNLKIYSVLPYIFEKKLNAYVCKVYPPPGQRFWSLRGRGRGKMTR